ncbi:MAG: HepT-like ribonuclease domain-containing protein [Anaerolineales bacterium]
MLQVIGEAARRVSAEYKTQRPTVPWSAIIGMRHKVVHDYLAVDYDIVWQTATQDLPVLILTLAGLVPPASPGE